MKNLEKRIFNNRDGNLIRALDYNWTMVEDFWGSECVRERSVAKSLTLLAMFVVALFSIVVFFILVLSIERGVFSSWPTRVTIGVLFLVCSVFFSWLLCWPRPSRHPCWRTAVDFVEAIRYVEGVTGQPFEEWESVESTKLDVARSMAADFRAIEMFSTGPRTKLRSMISRREWERRHWLVSKLFQDFPEIDAFEEGLR